MQLLLLLALFTATSSLRRFYATTISGNERILKQEIQQLPGISGAVKQGKLGCSFYGTAATGFHSVLNLRSALKICELVGETDSGISTPDDLYAFVKDAVQWLEFMHPTHHTLRVDTVLSSSVHSSLSHSHFSSLTVKNAIVDHIQGKIGDRPTIDTENPDVTIMVYIHKDSCSLYKVWSGCNSLHKRGYRQDSVQHKAALRETTAASLLLATEWNLTHENSLLIDPLCGSGSIPIEAALIKFGVAPGIASKYSITDIKKIPKGMNFIDVDLKDWASALELALGKDRRSSSSAEKMIFANDISPSALQLATESAKKANVFHLIDFSLGDVSDYKIKSRTDRDSHQVLAVTNPPWDLRLNEDADLAWEKLGSWTMRNMKRGQSLWTLAGNPSLIAKLQLGPPSEFLAIKSANVDMRFLHYIIK